MKNQPLYQGIYNDLKAAILNQTYTYQQQVPTEKELTESYQVSRITAKRALTELEKDGYIERQAGKGSFVIYEEPQARQQATYEIALMLPFSQATGLEKYVEGANQYLSDTPYNLVIHSTEANEKRQRELLKSFTKEKCDGLIIYPERPQQILDLIYQKILDRFPMVLIDKEIEGLNIPTVMSNNYSGGFMATKALIGQGHKKIAYLSTNDLLANSTVRDRYFGYLSALNKYRLENPSDQLIQEGLLIHPYSENFEAYLKQMKKLGFTAIVVENDVVALKLLAQAQKLKWSLPQDMSFVGFDNIEMTEIVQPRLTTIEQDFHRIGALAAEMLIHQIEGSKIELDEKYMTAVKLIQRDSIEKI